MPQPPNWVQAQPAQAGGVAPQPGGSMAQQNESFAQRKARELGLE